MIKGLVIAVALAALTSVIVTPAYSERYLFGDSGPRLSYVSTDSDADANVLTIKGSGDTATMELVKEKGEQAKKISLDTDNVLSIEYADEIRVTNNEDFSKALIDKQEVVILDEGVIGLYHYGPGVYTLNVVVDNERAYECILVIGPQPETVINKEIKEVNNNNNNNKQTNKQITDIEIEEEIIFEFYDDTEPESVPYCDEIDDSTNYGTCHDRTDNDEETGLYPCKDGSQEEDYRDCNGDRHDIHDEGKDEQPYREERSDEEIEGTEIETEETIEIYEEEIEEVEEEVEEVEEEESEEESTDQQ